MIIYGWKRHADPKFRGIFPCPVCELPRPCDGYQIKRRVTLFFIPVVPLWSDWIVECLICGSAFKCDRELFENVKEDAEAALAMLLEYEREQATLPSPEPDSEPDASSPKRARKGDYLARKKRRSDMQGRLRPAEPSSTEEGGAAQPRVSACPNCGHEDPSGRTSCPHCGMPLAPP